MANKTPTSLSLSDLAIAALDESNKSTIPNTMLEVLTVNLITLNYIRATTGNCIDYKKLVELGLEQLKQQADKQQNLRRFTQAMSEQSQVKTPNRNIFIRDNITSCATWQQLVELVAEHEIDLSDVKPPTAPVIVNHQFYYEADVVMRATDGEYTINKNGIVVKA